MAVKGRKKIIIKSLKQMDIFAAKFASTLKGGDVLALTGPLGSGKTAFSKALAKALGVRATVVSPTFLLLKCYNIKKGFISTTKTLCHTDAYRTKSPRELLAVGFGETLEDPAVISIVEWADKVEKIIPRRARWLCFGHGQKAAERTIIYN